MTPDIDRIIAGLSEEQLAAAKECRVRDCYVNHPIGTKCPNCADWPFKKGGATAFCLAVRQRLQEMNDG